MSAASGPAVALSDLDFSYVSRGGPTVQVLDGFNLVIPDPGIVWITGRNGVGKTTLLRIIAGVVAPEAGTVLIHGRPPSDARVGFVFQDPIGSLLPWYTVRRNIELPRQWRGPSSANRQTSPETVARTVGLEALLDRYPYQLSGGQNQMANVARAIAFQEDLLVLDEPFSHLDGAHRLALQRLLLQHRNDHGAVIILAAHDFELAGTVASRCIVLHSQPARIRADLTLPDASGDRSSVLQSVKTLIASDA